MIQAVHPHPLRSSAILGMASLVNLGSSDGHWLGSWRSTRFDGRGDDLAIGRRYCTLIVRDDLPNRGIHAERVEWTCLDVA